MDIQEKLAFFPIERVKATALAAEQKVLGLPRKFSSTPRESLLKTISKAASCAVVGTYEVSTGKLARTGLKNRELTRYGRYVTAVSLAVNLSTVLVAGHELWARARGPKTLDDYLRDLNEKFDGSSPDYTAAQ